MQKVKLFMGPATADGIVELESSINRWIEEENAKINNISVAVREIAEEKREALTGEVTDQLLVCLTYESE